MRNKDLNKQQRIKKAMVSLILKEGMTGASVSRIARKAGVSPATLYVYYASKEDMLTEVFNECVNVSYRYLMDRLQPDMTGEELIDALAKGIFAFAEEQEEIFSFVDQCSSAPNLQEKIFHNERCPDIFEVLHRYQEKGILRKCSDVCLAAILFAPIKHLAIHEKGNKESGRLLEELTGLLKELLLI